MSPTIYIADGAGRRQVDSLKPYLQWKVTRGPRMQTGLMRRDEAKTCEWLGHGFRKGVTHPEKNITVFLASDTAEPGVHAKLIADFSGVDPHPRCYWPVRHKLGFGGFIRWVYFSDPRGKRDFTGADWSLVARSTAGILTSFLSVEKFARALVQSGIDEKIELVLLNCRMRENSIIRGTRAKLGLQTLSDWFDRAPKLFRRGSGICPRCGQNILLREIFCHSCGCRPRLIYERS